jgi:hypothetical protein
VVDSGLSRKVEIGVDQSCSHRDWENEWLCLLIAANLQKIAVKNLPPPE